MFDLYFDYPYSMTPLKKVFKLKPQIGKVNQKNLLGFECSLWSEQIRSDERLENLLFPRCMAVALKSWGINKTLKYKEFLELLQEGKIYYQNVDIKWMKDSLWDPKGSIRKEEAINFFKVVNSNLNNNEETIEVSRPNIGFIYNFIRKFYHLSDIPSLIEVIKNKKNDCKKISKKV